MVSGWQDGPLLRNRRGRSVDGEDRPFADGVRVCRRQQRKADVHRIQPTKLSPKFLSGGRIGYAVRSATAAEEGTKIWNPDLRVVDVVKGAVRGPSWSPDGAHLVYERALRKAMTEHFIPTGSIDPEFELYLSEPFATFSPDGTQLLYSQYSNGGMNTSDTSIEIMNADGSGKRTLYHETGSSAFDPN